jgi:hypothetical protein
VLAGIGSVGVAGHEQRSGATGAIGGGVARGRRHSGRGDGAHGGAAALGDVQLEAAARFRRTATIGVGEFSVSGLCSILLVLLSVE